MTGAGPPGESGPGDGFGGTSRTTVAPPADVPYHRPWAWRTDAEDVERRFRRDRAGWRRRIECARRLSHDGADELVAPYHGRWTA